MVLMWSCGKYQVLIRCFGPKGHHIFGAETGSSKELPPLTIWKYDFLNKCLRKKRIGKWLKSLTIVMSASGGWSMRGSRTLGHTRWLHVEFWDVRSSAGFFWGVSTTTEIGQRAKPSLPSCATMGVAWIWLRRWTTGRIEMSIASRALWATSTESMRKKLKFARRRRSLRMMKMLVVWRELLQTWKDLDPGRAGKGRFVLCSGKDCSTSLSAIYSCAFPLCWWDSSVAGFRAFRCMSEGGHVIWGKRLLKWDWALGVPKNFSQSQMEGNNSCGPVDAGCTLSSLCLLHFQVAILQGGTITECDGWKYGV